MMMSNQENEVSGKMSREELFAVGAAHRRLKREGESSEVCKEVKKLFPNIFNRPFYLTKQFKSVNNIIRECAVISEPNFIPPPKGIVKKGRKLFLTDHQFQQILSLIINEIDQYKLLHTEQTTYTLSATDLVYYFNKVSRDGEVYKLRNGGPHQNPQGRGQTSKGIVATDGETLVSMSFCYEKRAELVERLKTERPDMKLDTTHNGSGFFSCSSKRKVDPNSRSATNSTPIVNCNTIPTTETCLSPSVFTVIPTAACLVLPSTARPSSLLLDNNNDSDDEITRFLTYFDNSTSYSKHNIGMNNVSADEATPLQTPSTSPPPSFSLPANNASNIGHSSSSNQRAQLSDKVTAVSPAAVGNINKLTNKRHLVTSNSHDSDNISGTLTQQFASNKRAKSVRVRVGRNGAKRVKRAVDRAKGAEQVPRAELVQSADQVPRAADREMGADRVKRSVDRAKGAEQVPRAELVQQSADQVPSAADRAKGAKSVTVRVGRNGAKRLKRAVDRAKGAEQVPRAELVQSASLDDEQQQQRHHIHTVGSVVKEAEPPVIPSGSRLDILLDIVASLEPVELLTEMAVNGELR